MIQFKKVLSLVAVTLLAQTPAAMAGLVDDGTVRIFHYNWQEAPPASVDKGPGVIESVNGQDFLAPVPDDSIEISRDRKFNGDVHTKVVVRIVSLIGFSDAGNPIYEHGLDRFNLSGTIQPDGITEERLDRFEAQNIKLRNGDVISSFSIQRLDSTALQVTVKLASGRTISALMNKEK